jgi:hypothetical protein
MRKVIIIIVCLVIGFILYTFIVAIYKANFNVDGALPAKNTSKEKPSFEKTKISTEKLNVVNGVSIDTSSTTDCGEACNDTIEKKHVEIYLIQNINKLIPKNSFYNNSSWSVKNYTVDTNANIGIVVFEDSNYTYTKDFHYTQDASGNISNMVLR